MVKEKKDYNKSQLIVSVIVLTYRNFDGLYETLETIFEQDYSSVELLISDDGSEEFPEDEILSWIQKHDTNRIGTRIIKNSLNLGLVAHSNRAAKITHGDLVKFLTPGDGFAYPQALSELVQFAQTHNRVVISPAFVCEGSFQNVCYEFPSARRVNILNKNSPEQLFSVIAATNIICAVGAIYPRAFFNDGGFDTSYRNLDDWPTWLKIYRQGEWLPCMNRPTVFYRIGGMSSKNGTAFDSPALKHDLWRCIETEIMPYRSRLTWISCVISEYRLCTLSEKRTIRSRMLYFPLDFYCWLKKLAKKILIWLKKEPQK